MTPKEKFLLIASIISSNMFFGAAFARNIIAELAGMILIIAFGTYFIVCADKKEKAIQEDMKRHAKAVVQEKTNENIPYPVTLQYPLMYPDCTKPSPIANRFCRDCKYIRKIWDMDHTDEQYNPNSSFFCAVSGKTDFVTGNRIELELCTNKNIDGLCADYEKDV